MSCFVQQIFAIKSRSRENRTTVIRFWLPIFGRDDPETGVCTSLLRSTFRSCVCVSRTVRVVVTCAQLLAVTCKSPQLVLLLMCHRSIAACARKLWNSLPNTLRHSALTVLWPAKNSPVWFSLRKRFVTVYTIIARYINYFHMHSYMHTSNLRDIIALCFTAHLACWRL